MEIRIVMNLSLLQSVTMPAIRLVHRSKLLRLSLSVHVLDKFRGTEAALDDGGDLVVV